MDAARFDINIEAKSIGVDATAMQISTLARHITAADTVATKFDKAVVAASKRLEEASAAAQLAATSLGAAEKRYRELEGAANKAAKAVEKAAASGKDTTALASAAAAAKVKMSEQAKVVDDLRAKSKFAAAEQTRLGGALGVLKGKQSAAAAEIKKAKTATDTSAKSTSGWGAAALGAAAAAAVMVAAVYAGMFALGAYALSTNPAATMRLNRAMERLQLGFRRLFVGLNFDKFVGGLEQIMSLFDQGRSSANGMKVLIETIFQPILDGAAKAAPYVAEMFKGMIYGALMVVIGVLRIRNAIFKAMSPETRAFIKKLAAEMFTLENAFKAGEIVAYALAAAVGVLLAIWLLMYGGVIAAVVGIILVIKKFGAITLWLADKWDEFQAFIGDTIARITNTLVGWAESAVNIAKSFVAGLVLGLTGGMKPVGIASADLGKQMATAAKEALDAHSPSRVAFAIGGMFGAGLSGGMDAKAGDVESSGADLAMAGAGGAANAAGASTSTSSSRSVVIQNLTIGDGPVAKSTFDEFKKTLLEVLEGASLTIGGGEAPAT